MSAMKLPISPDVLIISTNVLMLCTRESADIYYTFDIYYIYGILYLYFMFNNFKIIKRGTDAIKRG